MVGRRGRSILLTWSKLLLPLSCRSMQHLQGRIVARTLPRGVRFLEPSNQQTGWMDPKILLLANSSNVGGGGGKLDDNNDDHVSDTPDNTNGATSWEEGAHRHGNGSKVVNSEKKNDDDMETTLTIYMDNNDNE